MRRTFQILAVLTILASGLTGAVVAVVAYEAQVVQVGTSVSNALRVTTGNDLKFNESFPQEFRQDFTHVELSQSFKDAPRVRTAEVEVWLECRPDFTDAEGVFQDVKWMGDFAYLAKTDPFGALPGTATATTPTTGNPVSAGGRIPPNQGGALPNPPWEYVGGLPEDCEPGASVPNKIGVFTQGSGNAVFLDKSGDVGVDLFLGLDIPVCDFNFNTSTDPNPKPSGYDEPTVVIKSGDPRYEPQVDDPDCQYFAGMNLVFQVVGIGESTSVDTTPPSVLAITTLDSNGNGSIDSARIIFNEPVNDFTLGPQDWTIGGQPASIGDTLATLNDDTVQLHLNSSSEIAGTDVKDVTYVQGATPTVDLAGNLLANVASGDVTEIDGAAPILLSATWSDVDASTTVNAGDTLDFLFSEAMDQATVPTTGLSLDAAIVPSSGSYGADPSPSWNIGSTVLTVTLADTPTILPGATLDPASSVADLVGNSDGTSNAPSIVQAAASGTLIVTKTADTNDGACDADCSLREAIGAAVDGDSIDIPTGTYTLTLGSELNVNKNLTLIGAGSTDTVIQAAASPGVATHRVLNITGGTTGVSGVTIRHGNLSGDGGGIRNCGILTLIASVVTANASGNLGGGILNIRACGSQSGDLTLTNTTVSGNTAVEGGGIGIWSGPVELNDSTISGNTGSNSGGGISVGGFPIALSDTTVSNNTATGGSGGGIYRGSTGTITLDGSTISDNTSNSNGGGIYASNGSTSVTNSTINGNTSTGVSWGGGIYNSFGTLTVTNSTVSNNNVIRGGGGIDNGVNGTLTLTNSRVNGNTAGAQGGGVYNLAAGAGSATGTS